jgi:hypothetical protein
MRKVGAVSREEMILLGYLKIVRLLWAVGTEGDHTKDPRALLPTLKIILESEASDRLS